MVAGHYRWDFIGLSTDTKPDSSNPKVANGSTYYESDTSKLYVWYNNQWYEKTATGGGGYELPIASASTLGGVKVGEGLSIDSGGVLSASGGGGVTYLSSADLDYPDSNPDGIALWRLSDGIYFVNNVNETEIKFYHENANTSEINCESGKFDVFSAWGYKLCKFEMASGGDFYMGYTKTDTSGVSGVVKWYPDPE